MLLIVADETGDHWALGLSRTAELRWLSTRQQGGIVRRRSPRQWPLAGKFRGDTDRPELADCGRITETLAPILYAETTAT